MKIFDWSKPVGSFLTNILAEGFEISHVDNLCDEDNLVKNPTKKQAIEEICSVDESYVYFSHPDYPKKIWTYIVLGNDPNELLCDMSVISNPEVSERFDRGWHDFMEKWEGKECPMKEANY